MIRTQLLQADFGRVISGRFQRHAHILKAHYACASRNCGGSVPLPIFIKALAYASHLIIEIYPPQDMPIQPVAVMLVGNSVFSAFFRHAICKCAGSIRGDVRYA